jgi:hypothetical protein
MEVDINYQVICICLITAVLFGLPAFLFVKEYKLKANFSFGLLVKAANMSVLVYSVIWFILLITAKGANLEIIEAPGEYDWLMIGPLLLFTVVLCIYLSILLVVNFANQVIKYKKRNNK